MTNINIVISKTKSGKSVNVAVIPASMVSDQGPEQLHWRSVAIALEAGCSHYRVVDPNGQLVATAKAGEPKMMRGDGVRDDMA